MQMHYSASDEVAARWFLRRIALLHAQQVPDVLKVFHKAWVEVNGELVRLQNLDADGKAVGQYMNVAMPWRSLYQNGFELVRALLAYKTIPQGLAKKMEIASRFFMEASRTVRWPRRGTDMFAWRAKAEPVVEFLLKAAHWPDKAEGGNELFPIGPFKVHNTVGAAGDALDSLRQAVEKAIQLLPKAGVPGIARVLYGDINFVGKLMKGTTLAWYYTADDTLYVRLFTHYNTDVVHSIIHELGHRYLAKFANKATARIWAGYHATQEMRTNLVRPQVTYPAVGDPVEVAKERPKPIVQRIDGTPGTGVAKFFVSPIAYYTDKQIEGVAKARAQADAVKEKFPTPYAAKNWEEHFCEALAHKALGLLKPEAEASFDTIWVHGVNGRVARAL